MASIVRKSKLLVTDKTSAGELLGILLKNRGVKKEEVEGFLKPENPDKLNLKEFGVGKNGFEKSVKRIKKAVENKENILIYGDYDVDGITSTAILWMALNEKGGKVLPFIPDREKDGYGIKYKSFIEFEKAKNIKFSLLVTVDNGIVANKEIKRIKKRDVDVVIIDHHQKDENKLKVSGIIHSTGTSASVLSWLLAKEFSKKADLGLAALGAVADCVPLLGINRNIVYWGIKYLRENPNLGIKKLIKTAGVKIEDLSSYHLGFVIGPRINAVGRLGDATDALRLLCLNGNLLDKYADKLNQLNIERQKLQKKSFEMAKKGCELNKDRVIFISDKKYHEGVIGLIAGNLTEKYGLPAIVISESKKISKGSCRSIKELDIIKTLRETDKLLIDVGGHKGAAGFSIETKNIEEFRKKIIKIINKKLGKKKIEKAIEVEAEMEMGAVKLSNCKAIEKLLPFGMENQEPMFWFKNVKVAQKRLVGGDKSHLKLVLGDNFVDAIAFKKGYLFEQLKTGACVDIVAGMEINSWGGKQKPQLMVREINTNH
ncbi:single-stranded-DNA-specific exonuclease RecJ [Patescibacteria group bacterium]|nr:single-stranded-DNA-specific exonuclease RecJ [Patescibacteria group bacterium]MCG2702416.1 single-stranded-DNA-specific exonuclease RecJ [Candidatus Parcubacteria bacterium]MBU4264534.1 single-stranded-DNA-specific exonuclease RecJ [Patescibacteria group bacterium]MBU4390465.1 single-stranded-DNA-specific exonuclease RecJ [Patescibacteria group bacterium]MBU4397381.1 single-stranded-DNA-specific exonuclease RecJ [Patescibacteria group bacterium]